MKQVCLTPYGWAWVPLLIAGCMVSVSAFYREMDGLHPSRAVRSYRALGIMLLGMVVTIFAAFPFFLAWVTK